MPARLRGQLALLLPRSNAAPAACPRAPSSSSPSSSSSSSTSRRPAARLLSTTPRRAAPPPASNHSAGDTSHGSRRAAPLSGPSTSSSSSSSSTSSSTAAPTPRLRPRDRLQWIEDKNGSVLLPANDARADSTSATGKGKEKGKGKGKEQFEPADHTIPAPAPSSSSSSMNGLPGSRFVEEPTLSGDPSPSSAATTTPSPGIQDQHHPPPPPSTPPPPPTEIVIQAPMSGLPPLEAHQLPLRRVPFSTRKLVRELEIAGVERPLAETVMRATRGLLMSHEEKAKQAILNRQDLENEAYLFQAALSELKTGSQVKLRNDSITLRSLTANLQRETDGLEQKMKEDMQRLGSDIQLEMNARKEETATELQSLDKRVMDLNSKFTILLSEVRTEIEATKWVSTRRVMTAITITVVLLVAYFSATKSGKAGEQADGSGSLGPDGKKKKFKGGSNGGIPSIEELGVQPTDAEAEALLLANEAAAGGRGWAFWGQQQQPPTATGNGVLGTGKRIGSEGEDE